MHDDLAAHHGWQRTPRRHLDFDNFGVPPDQDVRRRPLLPEDLLGYAGDLARNRLRNHVSFDPRGHALADAAYLPLVDLRDDDQVIEVSHAQNAVRLDGLAITRLKR